MKEDILEQLVDDYLQMKGYFTQHNLRFRPRPDHPNFEGKQDSNHSDIDVIGLHPRQTGVDRVWVVSCKSWQSGFDIRAKLNEISHNKIRSGRESWRRFRELVQPKWSEAFCAAIEQATGQREFTYFTAVTRVKGDPQAWERHEPFCQAIGGNPIRILSLEQMVGEISASLSTTVVPSHLGRTLQLLRASGATINWLPTSEPDKRLQQAAAAAPRGGIPKS